MQYMPIEIVAVESVVVCLHAPFIFSFYLSDQLQFLSVLTMCKFINSGNIPLLALWNYTAMEYFGAISRNTKQFIGVTNTQLIMCLYFYPLIMFTRCRNKIHMRLIQSRHPSHCKCTCITAENLFHIISHLNGLGIFREKFGAN